MWAFLRKEKMAKGERRQMKRHLGPVVVKRFTNTIFYRVSTPSRPSDEARAIPLIKSPTPPGSAGGAKWGLP